MKLFMASDLHMDHYYGTNATVTAITKKLEKILLPADVVSIAGDISDSTDTFAKTIDALANLYKHVVFCAGNHDFCIHRAVSVETSEQKIHRALGKIKAKNVHYLDGDVVTIGDTKFVGCMGGYDFSYSYKHFGLTEVEMLHKWKSWYDGRFWNFPGLSPLDIQRRDFKKLSTAIEAGATVVLTHTGPLAFGIRPEYHNYMTGYFYFNGQPLLDMLPEGSIWQFGHTHDAKFMDMGNVKLYCNPIGYPDEIGPGCIEREKFLIDIK